MKLFIRDILPPFLLFAMVFLVPVIFVGQKKDEYKSIPISVRLAAFCEALFGIVILCYSFYAMVQLKPAPGSWFPPGYVFLIGLALTILWFVMASSLSQGVRNARKICLVMSILRIPCIIGVIFSAISIYLLYITRQSRDFYA